jgi:hypothetical protein
LNSGEEQILRNAEELAILYSHKDSNLSNKISFIDCLIAGQLMKYPNRLFLATLNHSDFPLFIFDRIHIETIDAGEEILTVGIYAFNQRKYEVSKHNFLKTSNA